MRCEALSGILAQWCGHGSIPCRRRLKRTSTVIGHCPTRNPIAGAPHIRGPHGSRLCKNSYRKKMWKIQFTPAGYPRCRRHPAVPTGDLQRDDPMFDAASELLRQHAQECERVRAALERWRSESICECTCHYESQNSGCSNKNHVTFSHYFGERRTFPDPSPAIPMSYLALVGAPAEKSRSQAGSWANNEGSR
jgi:hypothetical protein